MNMIDEAQRKRHGSRSFRLALISIALIVILIIVMPLTAPSLNGYAFLRFPLGLFLASHGAVIGMIALIYWVLRRQSTLDRRYGLKNEL